MLQQWFNRFETAVDKSIGRRNLGIGLMGLVTVYFIVFPLLPDQTNYIKTVYIGGFFYAILAASWVLLAGIAGQFSFGHMAFMEKKWILN